MARKDHWQRVSPIGCSDSTGGQRPIDSSGDLSVGDSFAIRNALSFRPDPVLEFRALGKHQYMELAQFAAKIQSPLLSQLVQTWM